MGTDSEFGLKQVQNSKCKEGGKETKITGKTLVQRRNFQSLCWLGLKHGVRIHDPHPSSPNPGSMYTGVTGKKAGLQNDRVRSAWRLETILLMKLWQGSYCSNQNGELLSNCNGLNLCKRTELDCWALGPDPGLQIGGLLGINTQDDMVHLFRQQSKNHFVCTVSTVLQLWLMGWVSHLLLPSPPLFPPVSEVLHRCHCFHPGGPGSFRCQP